MLMIRVEEWPAGDADRRRPIGRLEIANRTGLAPVSDYEVTLRPVVGEPGPPAMVYGHVRDDGWLPLARAALRAVDPDGGFYTSPTTQVPADVLAVLPLDPYVSRACQTARAVLAAGPGLDRLLAARGLERGAWAAEFFRSCRATEKRTEMQCQDPQHGDRCSTCGDLIEPYGMVRHHRAVHMGLTAPEESAEGGSAGECSHAEGFCDTHGFHREAPEEASDLTREELRDLVEDLGQQAYRAQDVLAFVREMCDAADRDGTAVTTGRVRSWLDYTGCGGVIVLPEEDDHSHRDRINAPLRPETIAALNKRIAGGDLPVLEVPRPLCAWPSCLPDDQQQQLADDVTAGMLGKPTKPMPDPRPGCGCVEPADPSVSHGWMVTATGVAPTREDAERRARGIGEMISVEFGDSMRPEITVEFVARGGNEALPRVDGFGSQWPYGLPEPVPPTLPELADADPGYREPLIERGRQHAASAPSIEALNGEPELWSWNAVYEWTSLSGESDWFWRCPGVGQCQGEEAAGFPNDNAAAFDYQRHAEEKHGGQR